MMDTVLNLGLNDASVEGLAAQDRQPALRVGLLPPLRADVRQRRARGPGRAAGGDDQGVEGRARRQARHRARRRRTARAHAALRDAVPRAHRRGLPQDPLEQLRQSIRAVFDSWMGERAIHYRRINRIPDDWGTAVNVQQMVFGNKGDDSGSGVAFSRDEVTGEPEPSGDFLQNAQGEDVVSGVRNTRDIAELADVMPDAHARADGDPQNARAPLRRHAGHRVHDRGGASVHAADAQRQAPGAGRGALRRRRGRRGAAQRASRR